MELTIKTCKSCNKRFVLDKGFYKAENNKDGYSNYCKSCYNQKNIDRETKKKEGNHILHKFISFGDLRDKCERCSLLRKRIPLQWKTNQYAYRYLVDNQWVREKPYKCN